MEVYEYLLTAIILIAILTGSTAMITILSEPSRAISEREQLKVAAQKVMTQLTLEPGDPPDWGSSLVPGEELRTFGLAKHSETTRDAYVLDPGKVSRLSGPSNLAISPSRAAELLNLKGTYGLRLEFRQALNVNVARLSASEFIVTVSTPFGSTPVADANVTAAMYLYEGGFRALEPIGGAAKTGVDGRCSLRFEELGSEAGVIILIVEHLGLRVVKVIPIGSQVERALLLEGLLILEGGEELSGEVLEIIPTYNNGGSRIINITQTISRVEGGQYLLSYLEPGAEAVLAASMDGSKLFYAPRVDEFTYSTADEERSTPFSYSLERSVVIGGSIYTLRLYIWRMSW